MAAAVLCRGIGSLAWEEGALGGQVGTQDPEARDRGQKLAPLCEGCLFGRSLLLSMFRQ